MPYIAVSSSKTTTDAQKANIIARLGEKISVIPGKTEERLMIEISDGKTMAFAGVQRELAYVDVKCYGKVAFEDKKAFTEAVFEILEQELVLPSDAIYLSFGEFENWGTLGSMK